MWITKPLVAFLTGALFVVSVLITAMGTAVLLALDIPSLPALSQGEALPVIGIATIFLLASACIYTLRQFSLTRTLRLKLDERRDLQHRLDTLARLRSTAINEIYSRTPKRREFKAWLERYHACEKEVEAYLALNFPFAVVEMFADLGAIIPYDFKHAAKDRAIRKKHIKALQMLAKQLTIIERLIRENSTLTLEVQPSFLEMVKWQDKS